MALFYDGCVLALMGEHDAAQARFAQMKQADRASRVLGVQAWIAVGRDDIALALAIPVDPFFEALHRHMREVTDTRPRE